MNCNKQLNNDKIMDLTRIKFMYLYIDTSHFESDFHYYKSVLKGKLHWAFDRFGAKVAAFEIGEEPLILIPDHITPLICTSIYDIKEYATVMELRNSGWKEEKGPFG